MVVALSQSGTSIDVLTALDQLAPKRLVALTNAGASPLAQRADAVIDIRAGSERAIPASKSVSASAAIVLWAAAIVGGEEAAPLPSALRATADAVERWLAAPGLVATAAGRLARSRGIAVLGAGYGAYVASELALKIKEASYVHAEGFMAGEFRHGSSAVLDESIGVIGLGGDDAGGIVVRALERTASTGATRYTIGPAVPGIDAFGPVVAEAFAPLGWLVAGQLLAFQLGRERHVDSDAPRGLSKSVT